MIYYTKTNLIWENHCLELKCDLRIEHVILTVACYPPGGTVLMGTSGKKRTKISNTSDSDYIPG